MNSLILGRNIHKARKDRGMTGDQLSELCNVSPTYLRQVEAGRKTPSLPFFVLLCDCLDVSPSYLLNGVVKKSTGSGMDELSEICGVAKPSELRLIATILKAALDVF